MKDITWVIGTVLFVAWTLAIFAVGYRLGVKDERNARWRK